MNELEIRAQAAYSYVAKRLAEEVDLVANLKAELAARDAQMKDLQARLDALEKPQ